jgi:hypothetical protein
MSTKAFMLEPFKVKEDISSDYFDNNKMPKESYSKEYKFRKAGEKVSLKKGDFICFIGFEEPKVNNLLSSIFDNKSVYSPQGVEFIRPENINLKFNIAYKNGENYSPNIGSTFLDCEDKKVPYLSEFIVLLYTSVLTDTNYFEKQAYIQIC